MNDNDSQNSTTEPEEYTTVPLNANGHSLDTSGQNTNTTPDGDINQEEPAERITIVDTEIEPDTQAYAVEVTGAPGVKAVTETHNNIQPPATPLSLEPTRQPKNKKRFVILGTTCTIAIAAIGLSTWWVIANQKQPDTNHILDTSSSSTEQPKLGITLTVADGTVEYMKDQTAWQSADKASQLSEGMQIRTGTDSRAVLTIDDGSAVRLDANTTVKLKNLSAETVEIEQIEGVVYSRVVPSTRSYMIKTAETAYTALGTAFLTIQHPNEQGVQVYQSSVKVDIANEAISEGKQFFTKNDDTTIKDKISSINLETLTDNKFIDWNLSQDESDKSFKEKLGVLSDIKQLKEQKQKTARADAEQKAIAKTEQKKTTDKDKTVTSGDKVGRGTMTLSQAGSLFSWKYSGKATHGYKLVYSKSNTVPAFGTDEAIYFGSVNEMSGSIPGKEKIGSGTYYVRVCAYTANTETEPCVDYSNVVTITY